MNGYFILFMVVKKLLFWPGGGSCWQPASTCVFKGETLHILHLRLYFYAGKTFI